jgi:hypothetical protein
LIDYFAASLAARSSCGRCFRIGNHYLLSVPLLPEHLGKAARSHWGVENRLH